MVEKLMQDALRNPTVETLLPALQALWVEHKALLVAYKELEEANKKLELENERMRRTLKNNSSNSSQPTSTDQKPSKPQNQYNSREKSGKKKGGQKGHAGKTTTKEQAQELVKERKAVYQVKHVGKRRDKYVSKYVLDVKTKVVVTEFRFYPDAKGKISIPPDLRSDVTYGPELKALCALLFSEGVVSNDRIQMVLSSLSGNVLPISTGTIYNICKEAARRAEPSVQATARVLRTSPVACTDATIVTVGGQQVQIRNISTEKECLYEQQLSKSLASLKKSAVLSYFEGVLVHDHETALYHFGSGHGECNAHLLRYLTKNSEEAHNPWSDKLKGWLCSANDLRKERMADQQERFSKEELARLYDEYDSIIAMGERQNEKTKGYIARKEERALLRRLRKYKENHLLFLKDFRVPFTNNMSERDLRKCKNRQKMAGGFREEEGCKMFCTILSFVETAKRKGENLMAALRSLFETPLTADYLATV